MSEWASALLQHVGEGLHARAVAIDAPHMASYMRDQFAFLGVRSPACRLVEREALEEVRRLHGEPTGADLLAYAEAAWRQGHREHQYVAARVLARRARLLGPGDLDRIAVLITTRAWWDTVDILAPNVVGPISRADPAAVVPTLDRWVVDDDRWLVRTALLHQLKAGDATDTDRLARYCVTAAPHRDVFVRKAVGWALRQYSYIDEGWVEAFVEEHADALSGLSRREAMKAIDRRRRAAHEV